MVGTAWAQQAGAAGGPSPALQLFPFVLVTLVVPLGLVINPRTRRFGVYFWIGMVLTAVVVLGVGALVLWYLVENQG